MADEIRNRWKQGASFEATCNIPASTSLPNLIGVTVETAVRCLDGTTYSLSVEIPDESKTIFIARLLDTTKWALGIAEWDVKITKAGKIMYTDTVELEIVRRITP